MIALIVNVFTHASWSSQGVATTGATKCKSMWMFYGVVVTSDHEVLPPQDIRLNTYIRSTMLSTTDIVISESFTLKLGFIGARPSTFL